MKVTYYLDDGYAGGHSRPHSCKVDDVDIEECETQAEYEELVNTAVEEDFRQKVSYTFTMPPRPVK